MRQRIWKARVAKILAEELERPKRWHYFSFAAEKFYGGLIIECHGLTDGIMKAHRMGVNPGGEVIAVPVPAGQLPPAKYRNRLLSKSDILEFAGAVQTLAEWKAEHENQPPLAVIKTYCC